MKDSGPVAHPAVSQENCFSFSPGLVSIDRLIARERTA